MDRLQKKCFIVSAGLHLLLALILLIGPAFLSSRTNSVEMPPLDFIPWRTVDAQASGGGNPIAKPPPATPPTPPRPEAAQPPPETARQPLPPKDIKPPKPESESFEASNEPKQKKLQISTTPVLRKSTVEKISKPPAQADARMQQLAELRSRAATQLSKAVRSLTDLSSSTTIEEVGHGGGAAYANYAQIVKSIYEQAWIPPDDAANDEAITKVTVTIASDGQVLSANIVRQSGDAKVDSSVRRTWARVTFIAPFPEGAKEKERTYTINFNLKAKRALG